MKRVIYRYLAVMVVAIMAFSCNVTRNLSDGEYLLSEVKIEGDRSVPRKDRVTVEKERYIRQLPNKRILGLYFNVWMYENANSIKNKRVYNFMRKKSEAPVLMDSALTERSVQNVKTYLSTRGYFSAQVGYEVDTTDFRRHRAKLRYTIKQGPATRIDSISYDFRDTSLRYVILADSVHSLLAKGEILDESVLEQERNRIAAMLNDRGYYNFTANSISYLVDTIGRGLNASVCMVVQPMIVGYNDEDEPIWEDHSVYKLRNINVYPTYDPMLRSTMGLAPEAQVDTTRFIGLNIIRDLNSPSQLRSIVLRRNIYFNPDRLYNASAVMHTQKELTSLGFFRNAKISFRTVDNLSQIVTDSLNIGDTTHYYNVCERYLDCDIYATPALKQSVKAEIEGSTTSTFTGLSFTLGYSNRNVFRGAESFDVSTRFGFEFMRARDVEKRGAQEIGISMGLAFPRFLLPFRSTPGLNIAKPRTRFEFAFDYQNRPYYSRNIFTTRLAYSWQHGSRASVVLRPVDINWINVQSIDETFLKDMDNQYLKTSFESQLNAGMSLSWIYNTQRSDFDQNVTIIRANLESVGNTLQGLSTLFTGKLSDNQYHTIFGVRYAQYVRGEASISHKIDLGDKMALAGRFFSGVGVTYGNSKDRSIPFDRMFYCGGANSMRGWIPRTLGPGNKPELHDVTYPSQVGDVRLEANIEYRFPIWWILNGAIFFDLGNVWYLRDIEDSNPEEVFHFNSFYKQLGFNTGFGLRLNLNSVIIRFDLGMQIHNPDRPEGERWIKKYNRNTTALNFSVGYPF